MAMPPKDPPQDNPPGKPKDVSTLPGKPKGVTTIPPEGPKNVKTLPLARRKDVDTIPPKGGAGQELYLRLMTEQLTGWDNPRVMLERALRENLFLLLAQKILSLKPGAPDPSCFEILLRLKQEEDSMLPPGGFFDVAESLGMMPKIDRWVVRAALTWCAARQKSKPAAQLPMLCINVSRPALKSTSFLGAVREELNASGVPPRTICFEINERDVIEHRANAEAFIAALKPLGCRFTIDAFGSVRVSFSYLEGLAFDFLKIDGILIDSIHQGTLGLATVKAINIVCREVGIRTIAEFVESKSTLDKMREIGVDYVQGFGISRPEPISKIP
jgi:EAL domain-containing protein (putative c-di-GMP-specific phosphodiesterase class I)